MSALVHADFLKDQGADFCKGPGGVIFLKDHAGPDFFKGPEGLIFLKGQGAVILIM